MRRSAIRASLDPPRVLFAHRDSRHDDRLAGKTTLRCRRTCGIMRSYLGASPERPWRENANSLIPKAKVSKMITNDNKSIHCSAPDRWVLFYIKGLAWKSVFFRTPTALFRTKTAPNCTRSAPDLHRSRRPRRALPAPFSAHAEGSGARPARFVGQCGNNVTYRSRRRGQPHGAAFP